MEGFREQYYVGFICVAVAGTWLYLFTISSISDYWRNIMDTIIFGFIFLAIFFHAVQWYRQVKDLGGWPVWFKIYKKF